MDPLARARRATRDEEGRRVQQLRHTGREEQQAHHRVLLLRHVCERELEQRDEEHPRIAAHHLPCEASDATSA